MALMRARRCPVQADEPKKRSFRKYTYRGVDLDQLLDMTTDELVELFAARQRRRCAGAQEGRGEGRRWRIGMAQHGRLLEL